jgi:23S rRNA (cytosine1962-C5)-methyltransferase
MPSALSLPPHLVHQVSAGRPFLRVDDLPSHELVRQAGRPLDLLDSRGELVGRGIADPENGVVRVVCHDGAANLDDGLLATRVRDAMSLRRRLGLLDRQSAVRGAFRLIHAEGDGLPGFTVEVYGDYAVQYVLARGLRDWGRRLAEALVRVAEELELRCEDGAPWPRGILQKVRDKNAARPGKPVQSVVYGEEPPEAFLVEEHGVPFEVHLLAGLNVGLFTDMREHRWRLQRFSRAARTLNLFAYTGSLSVAAALGGAARVTSVDLSSGVLKWAQANFRHAGLEPERHAFEVSDVRRFLERARRAAETYDLIVVDPPTYSAARVSAWSLKNDLGDLARAVLELLAPGGVLWLSANSRALSDAELDGALEAAARGAQRPLSLLERGGLPPDCPTALSFPEGNYLKLRILTAR